MLQTKQYKFISKHSVEHAVMLNTDMLYSIYDRLEEMHDYFADEDTTHDQRHFLAVVGLKTLLDNLCDYGEGDKLFIKSAQGKLQKFDLPTFIDVQALSQYSDIYAYNEGRIDVKHIDLPIINPIHSVEIESRPLFDNDGQEVGKVSNFMKPGFDKVLRNFDRAVRAYEDRTTFDIHITDSLKNVFKFDFSARPLKFSREIEKISKLTSKYHFISSKSASLAFKESGADISAIKMRLIEIEDFYTKAAKQEGGSTRNKDRDQDCADLITDLIQTLRSFKLLGDNQLYMKLPEEKYKRYKKNGEFMIHKKPVLLDPGKLQPHPVDIDQAFSVATLAYDSEAYRKANDIIEPSPHRDLSKKHPDYNAPMRKNLYNKNGKPICPLSDLSEKNFNAKLKDAQKIIDKYPEPKPTDGYMTTRLQEIFRFDVEKTYQSYNHFSRGR